MSASTSRTAPLFAEGPPLVSLELLCPTSRQLRHYVEQVLGERVTLQGDYYEDVANALKGRRFYYRVGYCPVEFYGDLAVATTLLVPGMEARLGTPEGRLIGQSGLPADKVTEKRVQRERQLSMKALIDGGDFSLVQVVPRQRHCPGRRVRARRLQIRL